MDCTIDDCTETAVVKGMCSKHYDRSYYLANKARINGNGKLRYAGLPAEPRPVRPPKVWPEGHYSAEKKQLQSLWNSFCKAREEAGIEDASLDELITHHRVDAALAATRLVQLDRYAGKPRLCMLVDD